MKLRGAEEEDLAEGEGEMMGDLREGESGRIAAEEEIEEELFAGSDAGDETAAVLRKTRGDEIVRGLRVLRKGLERRSGRDNRRHGRRPCNRRDERKADIRRLARLPRREDIARLLSAILRARRDLIATRDHLVHNRHDLVHRFLHRQFCVPFIRLLKRHFPLTHTIMSVITKLPAFPDSPRSKASKKPRKNAINYFQKALDELNTVIFYYQLFEIILPGRFDTVL